MDLSPGDLPSGESTFGRNDLVLPDIRLVMDYKIQAIFRLLVRVSQCCVKLLLMIVPQYSPSGGQLKFS